MTSIPTKWSILHPGPCKSPEASVKNCEDSLDFLKCKVRNIRENIPISMARPLFLPAFMPLNFEYEF